MVTLKYEKIINHIKNQISEGLLKVGDPLPSINNISSQFSAARETVVKAYKILKDEGLIESRRGKGYFLLKETLDYKPSIFLMLNSFNPYMEVLYNAFKKQLNNLYNIDIYFHHNNIEVFKSLIRENRERYQSFVIKPFVHDEVPKLLQELDDKYLLILDRPEYITPESPFICQDFRHGFYTGLVELLPRLHKYDQISFITSSTNPHPPESEKSFIEIARKQKLSYTSISDLKENDILKNSAYIVVSDDDLIQILKKAKSENWKVGEDIGILTYNDSPLYEFISGGITSISADFEEMGIQAAIYAKNRAKVQKIIPTTLNERVSL